MKTLKRLKSRLNTGNGRQTNISTSYKRRNNLYQKKFVAEDVVELLDDLSLSDFTFFLSHFLRNICFSLQLKEDNEENDKRNVILHLDERHDQPIAYGGQVYLHLVPFDHADCRVKFRRDLTMYDMEKKDEVE